MMYAINERACVAVANNDAALLERSRCEMLLVGEEIRCLRENLPRKHRLVALKPVMQRAEPWPLLGPLARTRLQQQLTIELGDELHGLSKMRYRSMYEKEIEPLVRVEDMFEPETEAEQLARFSRTLGVDVVLV